MNDSSKYITISMMNNYLKNMFDQNIHLRKVYLRGEISNFKHHSSGHLYLTLKDEESRISAVMFKSNAVNLSFEPTDGMKVLATGRISVYPSGGNYQIYLDTLEQDGLGNLYLEFEKLKKKLGEEGLFKQEHKRPLPKFPMSIGVVTAPTGAAIRDITSTIKRRFPLAEVILFPSLVQGVSAKEDIARKIEIANTYPIDLLIVGRGGGSIEDLWAFNEEIVARAIYNSKVPVISAVGHEIDFTIADFVADMRAPTPTGAAEMAVPTTIEVSNIFNTKKIKIASLLNEILIKDKQILNKFKTNYILNNPMNLYEVKIQKLDNLEELVKKHITNYLDNYRLKTNNIKSNYILQNPLSLYEGKIKELVNNKNIINKEISYYLDNKNKNISYIIQSLKLLNPLNILDKGYSVVKKDDKIIKDTRDISLDDVLNITLSKGKIDVVVKEIL